MRLADLKDRLTGQWSGTNLLRLGEPDTPDSVSPSNLSIEFILKEKFLSLKYTWSHLGVAHEGRMILGYHNAQHVATAAWIDSWHQSGKVMLCEGTIDEQGVIELKGFYEAPPDADWGWRITIRSGPQEALLLTMYNCSPNGDEELAVSAEYARQN